MNIEGGSPPNLRIGSYTSIDPDVQVFLKSEHRIDWVKKLMRNDNVSTIEICV
jgi:hypothetical protein